MKYHKHHSAGEILEITQKQYSANATGSYARFNTGMINAKGEVIRVHYDCKQDPVARIRWASNGEIYGAHRVIHITDAPTKPLPVEFENGSETVSTSEQTENATS